MMQQIIAKDTLDPDQKEVAFTNKAWLNLRKLGNNQYLYLRVETVLTKSATTSTSIAKAATKKGCGCGKKK